jgi:hypothetical protein
MFGQPNLSPLTGKTVQPQASGGMSIWGVKHDHSADGFADFYFSEDLAMWFSQPREFCGEAGITVGELAAAMHVIRSHLWREKIRNDRPLLVVTNRSLDGILERAEEGGRGTSFRIVPVEQFVNEVRTLTFAGKAMETLENIRLLWESKRQDTLLPHVSLGSQSQTVFRYKADEPNDGLGYGAQAHEVPFLFEFLVEEGLLKDNGGKFRPSGKGLGALDEMKRGRGPARPNVFLVRRYDSVLDEFLNPVMNVVSERLEVPIEAVWDREHNDLIDERIFRLIRQASVVVVHVTADRYNVGLEHGYALALGKPVVVIRETPEDDDPTWKKQLPFDIANQNCFDYTTDAVGRRKLIDKLVARIGLGLDLTKVSQQ